jgi:hypothetical protein
MTRLYPPPRTSRSATRRLAKELPISCLTRPTATNDPKSWSAKSEPFGPGRMTLPPPLSSVTSAVYEVPPSLPVTRPPQRGAVMVRVYTAWIGVAKRSIPSRKKGRFSE